jgi:hypothetical protein
VNLRLKLMGEPDETLSAGRKWRPRLLVISTSRRATGGSWLIGSSVGLGGREIVGLKGAHGPGRSSRIVPALLPARRRGPSARSSCGRPASGGRASGAFAGPPGTGGRVPSRS